MSQVCALFEISRQAHYQKQWREAEWVKEQELILEMVRMIRRKHPRMGTRKLYFKLQPMMREEGVQIGRDRLFDLLREEDLLIARKKTYRRTTIPGYYRAPNRLPGMVIAYPNQVWVCDITYLEVEGPRFAYLFLVMDLFSRCILGWQVSPSLGTDGAVDSLEMALSQLGSRTERLIHHSDHGVQYTAHRYLDTLLAYDILPSMGAVGNCYDNIFAERVIGILKGEYGLDRPFAHIDQIPPVVGEVVGFYNSDRPHLSLKYATPRAVFSGAVVDVPSLSIPVAG